MTPINDPICFKCKYFQDVNYPFGCKAFPEGIPDIILIGDDNHSKPLPEQNNDIVFEEI